MALIGQVVVGPVHLHQTFDATPAMELQFEEFRMVSEDPRLAVWASGDDFDEFESALETDPTVAEYRYLSELQERRLYQLVFPPTKKEDYLYPVLLDENIIILRSTITQNGIDFTARFPSRDSVEVLREGCRDRDISFHLTNLYRESTLDDGCSRNPYGVTEPQQELLLHALETGYFEVPRQTDLKTIAEEFDVSAAAVSTRLRRGQRTLLRNTLGQRLSSTVPHGE